MRLVVDESIPRCIWERLRQDGHIITLAREIGRGQPDAELLAYAARENAAVLTEDLGLGRRMVWGQLPPACVIHLTMSGIPRSQQSAYASQLLATRLFHRGLNRIGWEHGHPRGGHQPIHS